jgi:hypothetical protein
MKMTDTYIGGAIPYDDDEVNFTKLKADMKKEAKPLSFRAAARRLRCTPAWLSAQIHTGKIRYTLETMRDGTARYWLSRDDIETLRAQVPVYTEVKREEPTSNKPTPASSLRQLELKAEAAELGMSLEDYKKEMGLVDD